ncbi:trypsin-like peptidase domain-containing protein [Maribacter luteus]|uniref:trypsin-like peptidase domain-containing protein n=1 Tax=Maribacter luteus TaxID=2594478 RepID=UPI002490CC5F|nr:trypsin-like peptidase domain-containing protein [Maribacter luteus]
MQQYKILTQLLSLLQNKIEHKGILCIFLFLGTFCHSQYYIDDNDLRDFFSSILYLSGDAPETVQIRGEQFEVLYRKPWTDDIIEKKVTSLGTGFLIHRGLDVYLVTAEHVARFIKSSSRIKYLGTDGQKKEISLEELTLSNKYGENVNWIRHPTADIAILHLGIFDNIVKDIVTINYEYLEKSIKAPNRFNDITIIGYPLGLGVNPTTISPITRNTRTASDIVYFKRFDNGVINPFIIADDPSIGGFSGGPVLEVYKSKTAPSIIGERTAIAPTLIGLVHGNLSNEPGGFAAIVPAFQILETLKLASKYSGEYTFYYPNGKLWSKRIYKDGLPWTVLSNYDLNGKPQEKGTLKEGEGTLYDWNEEGTVAEIINCHKGNCSGGVFAVKKESLNTKEP